MSYAIDKKLEKLYLVRYYATLEKKPPNGLPTCGGSRPSRTRPCTS